MLKWSIFRIIKITLHKKKIYITLLGQSTLEKNFTNILIKIFNLLSYRRPIDF